MQNSNLSDVNELYFGLCLNNHRWFSREAEQKYRQSIKKISAKDWSIQTERAKVMADEVIEYAKRKKYVGVEKIYWVARTGTLQNAVDVALGKGVMKIHPRNNPTDILVKFKDGPASGLLGVSLKSTSRSNGTTFKNRTLGSLDEILHINLSSIEKRYISKAEKDYNLPNTTAQRKVELQKTKNKKLADEISVMVLTETRDKYFDKLNKLDSYELTNHLISFWMDSEGVFPPFIVVKGRGDKEGRFDADISEPLKRSKALSAMSKDIKISKLGDYSIGFSAGADRICTVRFKYRDTKFASPIKLSAEPWR